MVLVDSSSALYVHAARLRAWIDEGLDDGAIVSELGTSLGIRCSRPLVAKFRAREVAGIDIQRAWQAYRASMFQPSAYETNPEHGRELSRGNALLDWITMNSWTFCEQCGRRRPNTSLSELSCPALLTPQVRNRNIATTTTSVYL